MNDNQLATRAFEPCDIESAKEISKILCASRLLPRSVQSPEAAFAIIVCGRELGLTAMQSLRGIHIVEGKPILASDTMLALALQSEKCEYFQVVVSNGAIATYETKRRGAPQKTALSFTIEQAQAAGVTSKDNWKKYPDAMLRARCIAALARMVYPDVFMGIYDPDELSQDLPPIQAATQVVARAERKAAKHAAYPPSTDTEKATELAADSIIEPVSAEQVKGAPAAAVVAPAQAAASLASVADILAAIGEATTADELKRASGAAMRLKLTGKELDDVKNAWGSKNRDLAPTGRAA